MVPRTVIRIDGLRLLQRLSFSLRNSKHSRAIIPLSDGVTCFKRKAKMPGYNLCFFQDGGWSLACFQFPRGHCPLAQKYPETRNKTKFDDSHRSFLDVKETNMVFLGHLDCKVT